MQQVTKEMIRKKFLEWGCMEYVQSQQETEAGAPQTSFHLNL